MIALGLVVFIAACAYDLAFARYTIAAGERRALHAATWSVTIYLLGLVGLLGVVEVSRWMIAPEVLGLWVGSFVGCRRIS